LKDIKLAVNLDVDWLAMSFVRSADDYDAIKKELEFYQSNISLIAKIEKPEAINDLKKIIMKFDGILVARGDLGVEISLHELPILQKKIVNECLKKQKPVIIATQMMESMIKNPKPTRAEINDIANAIYDGADAVMLSGETAIGKFPIDSVQIMSDIANSVEMDFDLQNFNRYISKDGVLKNNHRSSICHAAMNLADDLSINTIVILTESGKMAMQMAQYRPKAQIVALCSKESVFRFLALIWGINSVLIDSFIDTDGMFDYSSALLVKKGYLKKGDKYIITAGAPIGVSGSTNMLKIHKA
jgi:pyruvate kinase